MERRVAIVWCREAVFVDEALVATRSSYKVCCGRCSFNWPRWMQIYLTYFSGHEEKIHTHFIWTKIQNRGLLAGTVGNDYVTKCHYFKFHPRWCIKKNKSNVCNMKSVFGLCILGIKFNLKGKCKKNRHREFH